jgi:hypothetical protein
MTPLSQEFTTRHHPRSAEEAPPRTPVVQRTAPSGRRPVNPCIPFPRGIAVWRALAAPLVSMLSATLALGAEPSISRILGPRIGPVLLGFTRAQVEAELGRPDLVVPTGDVLDPEIRYPGFTVWLEKGGKVAKLRSTNPKYCLPGNVCPGASVASVRASLGSPLEGSVPGAGLITYPVISSVDERCLAEIALQEELVVRVEVNCLPHGNSR